MFTRSEYRFLPSRSPPSPVSVVEKEADIPNCPTCARLARQRWYHWSAHLASSIALLILFILHFDPHRLADTCWDLHNYYSPVNVAVAQHPHVTTRYNGSLWHDSPFKGPPTPAVEDAWHSIMQYGMIAASASDLQRVNHSLRTAVRFPSEAGGGYMVTPVGTHQIHCLHYIWQDHHHAAFPDVVRKMKEIPEMYERHYEHCVDYIRQSIMCQFDTALVTYDWVRDHQQPTPNSNAMHKCVDWDALQAWLKGRAVEVPMGFEWRQPVGQESLPWNP
ncbi:hypothetical protein P171DRAFT_223861 [Karstenula rhodostoma CBS 690.94]|uniref:Tat pathway signal sequence n=1 Tax=Karstenula rhodostoma CBS 690.94 TaxID=1392251 RepID=A0A9P4PQX8_9PLEO|nr:hypothetical protein P171DRAFT_223861 [Karstenula rhodostoma CBS 690.94]